MVATCAFGAGINYAHVRSVICLGIPNKANVNQFFQQAGRAGRDGRQAWVLFVSQKQSMWQPDQVTEDLLNRGMCPIRVISSVLDESGSSCLSHLMKKMCGPCTAISGPKPAIPYGRGQAGVVEGRGLSGTMGRGLEGTLSSQRTGLEGMRTFSTNQNQTSAGGLGKNVNQRHVESVQLNERELARRIGELQQKFSGCCGWCLAKNGRGSKHTENFCDGGLRNSCYACRSK